MLGTTPSSEGQEALWKEDMPRMTCQKLKKENFFSELLVCWQFIDGALFNHLNYPNSPGQGGVPPFSEETGAGSERTVLS